eukprot:763981-Hanusia_phi.AAC.5
MRGMRRGEQEEKGWERAEGEEEEGEGRCGRRASERGGRGKEKLWMPVSKFNRLQSHKPCSLSHSVSLL